MESMEFVLLATGVALATGVKVISLIVELCTTFRRPEHQEANPTRLPGSHRDAHVSRHPRSFRS